MNILKIAIEWAKAEVLSSMFFILFGIMFVLATVGFWQLGKTEVAKAFIFPTLVAGMLLLTIGLGIFFSSYSKITSFADDYNSDPKAFVQSEMTRTEKTMWEYKTIVFKIIPLIMVFASLLIIFVDKPIWRAISITTIALMAVILLIDSNANARIETYNKELVLSTSTKID